MGRRNFGKLAKGSSKRWPWFEAVRASGRTAFGGRGGGCETDERGRTVTQEQSKKGFHTFPRWERGPGWTPGAFGTRAGQPDSRESAAVAKLFINSANNTA